MADVGDFDFVADNSQCPVPPVPVAPSVVNIIPSTGVTIASDHSVQFDVIDASEGIRRIIIYVTYAHNGLVEVIHTGDGFCPAFSFLSTRTVITNGYTYNIIRTAGWLDTSITITVDAISDGGAED